MAEWRFVAAIPCRLTTYVTSPWHRSPPERLLVAAGPDSYPQFVTEALAPFELRATGRARYECELIAAADLQRLRARSIRRRAAGGPAAP